MNAQRLERQIADPFIGKFEQNAIMEAKDKEMNQIKSYQRMKTKKLLKSIQNLNKN